MKFRHRQYLSRKVVSDEEAQWIRKCYVFGGVSLEHLAAHYRAPVYVIRRVVLRRPPWTHLRELNLWLEVRRYLRDLDSWQPPE